MRAARAETTHKQASDTRHTTDHVPRLTTHLAVPRSFESSDHASSDSALHTSSHKTMKAANSHGPAHAVEKSSGTCPSTVGPSTRRNHQPRRPSSLGIPTNVALPSSAWAVHTCCRLMRCRLTRCRLTRSSLCWPPAPPRSCAARWSTASAPAPHRRTPPWRCKSGRCRCHMTALSTRDSRGIEPAKPN